MKIKTLFAALIVFMAATIGAGYAAQDKGKAGENGNYAREWCPMFLPNDKVTMVPCPPKEDHFPDVAMPNTMSYEVTVSSDGKTACVNTPELESCWRFSDYHNYGGMAWIKRKDGLESDSWLLFGWYWCTYTGCQGKNRTYSIKSIGPNGIEMYVLKDGTPIDLITFKDDYVTFGDRFYHINSRSGTPDYLFTWDTWLNKSEYYGVYCDPTASRPPKQYPGWIREDTLTGRMYGKWIPGRVFSAGGCNLAFRFGLNRKLNAFPKVCSPDELEELTANYESFLSGNAPQKIGTSRKFGQC